MKKVSLLFVVALLFGVTVIAQKDMRAKKGDYSFLKGQTALNLEFDYSVVKVGNKKKLEDEKDYINRKVAHYNKKENGKGDRWKIRWLEAKEKRYEMRFEKLINSRLERNGLQASKNIDASYSLVVRTIKIDPGLHNGILNIDSWVDFEFDFIENSSQNIVASYKLIGVNGSLAVGFDFDVIMRIGESYANGGKMLGSYIEKSLR